MPDILHPASAAELREALQAAGASQRSVELFGANSKQLMAGAIAGAHVQISTTGLKRILHYEPKDLTLSVEAGMPFAELSQELARHGQMIPLDGPYSQNATIGGVVAANISGPRRRLYGTARDLVIGMEFVTLAGKVVKSGGMVVKNVAGLDMGKLMIGSFGTLAAIASVNFKLLPRPAVARTLLFTFDDLKTAMGARDAAIRGQLTPVAVDLVNPILAAQMNLKGYVLALQFAGNNAVIERSQREAAAFGASRALTPEEEQHFWHALQHVTQRHLEKFNEGVVARISTTLSECGAALATVDGPGHAHAANGIVRTWFSRPDAASKWLAAGAQRGWKGVIEFSTKAAKQGLVLWPSPGSEFAIMKEIKQMFDPQGLLNRGRLYGQL